MNHRDSQTMNFTCMHTEYNCLTTYLIIMFLQKCPKLVPFHNGTFGDKGYQGKKEINVLLHTLNQRSRDNPKVKRHEMYCWQLQ